MPPNWLDHFCLLATLAALASLWPGADLLAGAARAPERQPSSRVRDLVNFYEQLERSSHDQQRQDEQQSVALTLTEAASKLHVLAHTLPLEQRCSKYFRLIDKASVSWTVASVSQLIKENLLFSESIQPDANLLSRLASEREFNALGRIQTILQTLEAERSLGKSNFEPAVERHLLACVNYYIYRHQTATDSVIEFVRAALDKIKNAQVESSASELLAKQFAEPLDKIRQLELQGSKLDHLAWIEQLAKLQQLIVEQHFVIPNSIQQFLNEPKRLARISSLAEVPKSCAALIDKILALELNHSRHDEQSNLEYRRLLIELNAKVLDYGDILAEDVVRFVRDPERQGIIKLDQQSESKSSDLPAPSNLQSNSTSTSSSDLQTSAQRSMQAEFGPMSEMTQAKSELVPDEHESPLVDSDIEELIRSYSNSTHLPNDLNPPESSQERAVTHESNITESLNTNYTDEEQNNIASLASQPQSAAILVECNDFLEIKYEPTASKVTDSMAKLLHKLNNQCYLANFRLWTANYLTLQQNTMQSDPFLRDEIADELEKVCSLKIAEGEQEIYEQDCKLVFEICEFLRTHE